MSVLTSGSPQTRLEMTGEGYVLVATTAEGLTYWEHPDETCLRLMRTGLCLMPKAHRGRCTTVTFYCDSCHRVRRGHPAVSDEHAAHCFPCLRRWERERFGPEIYNREEF